MSFKLIEIPALSGPACKIYSIAYDGSSETSFDGFQDRMDEEGFADEVDQIWYSLRFMGEEGGARIQFFREDEGRPGDGVVALLKKKRFALRLYCIRYGNGPLVLGDGGYKPPSAQTWQDVPYLSACVEELMRISILITRRIKDKEIKLAPDGTLTGDLEFDDDTV